MSRAPRSIVPGLAYHVISRFVDREWFIRHDRERAAYLSLLGRAFETSDWRCIGYAVMSNHIHIAAVAGEQPLSSWSRRVNSPFADFMNKEHDRIGPLFARGPRALETVPSDVGRLVAYVHNNPVRAEVVENAIDSTWTSHRAYLGIDRPPVWLDVELGLRLCGFDEPSNFDRFVRLHPDDPAREALERGDVEIDPSAMFRDAVEAQASAHTPPTARVIIEATAVELGIAVGSFRSPCRKKPLKLARDIAIHAASVAGVTGTAIADALGLTQSGASRALQRGGTRPQVVERSASVLKRVRERECHGSHV